MTHDVRTNWQWDQPARGEKANPLGGPIPLRTPPGREASEEVSERAAGLRLVRINGSEGRNMTIPIDLEKEFGRRWRIELDEVMKPRSPRKLSETHAAALALGRLVKKSHCQSAIGAPVGPTGRNLATDTHVAERLSTGSIFSSNGRNVI